jgi:WD40 repeat protein
MARFQPDARGLVTGSRSGVECWPIIDDPSATASGGRVRVGPSGHVDVPAGLVPSLGCLSRDGRTLAWADLSHQTLVVQSLDGRGEPMILKDQPTIGDVALSADGRWLAIGTWHGTTGTRLWDIPARRLVKVLATHDAHVGFSPEGRWLVTGSADEYDFWEVGSWKPVRTIPRERSGSYGPMAFTADGRMLAIAPTNLLVRLIDTATGRDLADLTGPEQQPISSICFSPHGDRLVVASRGQLLKIWDLDPLRRELAKLALDWESGDGTER